MDTELIFLAIAAFIVAVAVFMTWLVRRKRPVRNDPHDLNANPRDGDAIATWSGIDEADHR